MPAEERFAPPPAGADLSRGQPRDSDRSGASLRADTPLQFIRGVGPRRAEALASLKLSTVRDLLEYLPFRHQVELGEVEIADLRPNTLATVRGEVLSVSRRWTNLKVEITDGTGFCTLRWFSSANSAAGVAVGATVLATGKVQVFNDDLELVQPTVRVFAPDATLPLGEARGRLAGVYSGNEQAKSSLIRRVVQTLLAHERLPIDDPLPSELLARRDLPPREQAVRHMHEPPDEAALAIARKRLAYEELLLLETAMAIRRRRVQTREVARVLRVTPEIDARIRARFPFALTAAQDRAAAEIARDLESGRPMTRLLQGDVGSGKTVVALYACLAAIAHGRQAAIMAPTEILASQHFGNIERYLDGSRVRRVLLRGAMSRAERAAARERIDRGEIDLVVGTQALLESDVSFHDLAAVVVDEQHKFGVMQRADLRTKGPLPHYLLMTATPIPRTLAMTVFGDLDVSVLDACPPGRGRVVTKLALPGQWTALMEQVGARLRRGEQAYVVCPTIGDADGEPERPPNPRGPAGPPLMSAHQTFARLMSGPWRDLPVGLLHGALPGDEKSRVMSAFAQGELAAIVATTVVEVGVDVPAATVMVVENAERFGLSQLHQLRGRVGRGGRDGLCVLIARSRAEKTRERLNVMLETTDGFRIAEADLRLRGPGELLGTRQHGLPELRVASLIDDFELLQHARDDAFELIRSDPELRMPKHARLLPAVRRLFADKLRLLEAG